MKPGFRALTCCFMAAMLGLMFSAPAYAMGIRSIEEFLVNDGDLPFSGVDNLIATFTFEDPDETGLGDTLAFLASKQILFDAQVGSLAIILFQQGLTPKDSGLGYFEKVEEITADRGFIQAFWGQITRDGDELVIDSYVQLFPERASRLFDYRFNLDGIDQPLKASVAPSRIWVSSIRLPLAAADKLHTIAESVRTLRTEPGLESDRVPNGYLGEGATYRVLDREGSWVYLAMDSGVEGWTSVDAQCSADRECAELLNGARFLNNVLRYANHRVDEVPVSESYELPARALANQVRILETLENGRSNTEQLREAYENSQNWLARKGAPGGAAFANLRALARLRILQNTGEFSTETVREVADDLARSSLEDPGNLDVLGNLAVLFQFLGDDTRSQLAQTLHDEQLARSRH